MPEASSEAAGVKNGDLVLLDYELWAEGPEGAELVDTSRPEVADRAKAKLPAGTVIEPRAHRIGGEYFPRGIEEALVGRKIGEVVKKEFAPAEAFGERDPKLIELFSRNEIARLPEMRKEDAELGLGTVLTIRGRRGRVVTITAGRIRVDFNPELAGRKVRGEFKVVQRIEGKDEEARAIVDLTYGRGREFEVSHREGVITLKLPERAKFDLAWAVAKPRVIEELRSQLKPKAIHLLEEYVTPAAGEKAGEKSGEKPSAKAAEKASPSPA